MKWVAYWLDRQYSLPMGTATATITSRINDRLVRGFSRESAVVHSLLEVSREEAAEYAAAHQVTVRKSWTRRQIADACAKHN